MGHGLSLYLSTCVTHFCCQAKPDISSDVVDAELLITPLLLSNNVMTITFSLFVDSTTIVSKTSASVDAAFVMAMHRCVVGDVSQTTQTGKKCYSSLKALLL